MRVKNCVVLDNFINERGTCDKYENHSQNLWCDGKGFLLNYGIIIALWYNGKCYINPRKYSSTTSRHQKYIKRYCKDAIIPISFDEFIELMYRRHV